MVSILVVAYPSYLDPSSIDHPSCTFVVKTFKKDLLGTAYLACVTSLENVRVGSVDCPIKKLELTYECYVLPFKSFKYY